MEEKQNKRKALGFVFLTIATIAFMLYFGIPLLVKLSNFAYDLKKSGETIETSDKTPPPPPRFSELPAFTKNEKLEVSGNTEPAASVTISLNNETAEVLANNDGEFSQSFSLKKGENTLYAFAKDSSGNQSQDSKTYTIILDKETPEVAVTKPSDGETFYGNKNRQITIEGTTEKDAQIQINDRLVIVDSTGTFSTFFTLQEGDNNFTVKSEDQAGNTTETSFSVKYVP